VKSDELAGRRALLAATALLLAGCALTPRADEPIEKEVLDALPRDVPHRAGRGGVLLVLPPQAAPAYDTAQMAYALKAHQIAYFARHEWVDRPARLLRPLLVRTLDATGFFAAVVEPPYAGRHRYVLQCELLELLQDFGVEPPLLSLMLRVQLGGEPSGQLGATREIEEREPLQHKHPYAGVVAANAALARALREVAAFVLERAR
jgi:cholesterol transport system auxiliary component